MDYNRWRVFRIKIKTYKILYGMIMYLAFINIAMYIYSFITKADNKILDGLLIISFAAIIVFSYLVIMRWLNPLMTKYGGDITLGAVCIKQEEEKKKRTNNGI
jgi:hypothetical protein